MPTFTPITTPLPTAFTAIPGAEIVDSTYDDLGGTYDDADYSYDGQGNIEVFTPASSSTGVWVPAT